MLRHSHRALLNRDRLGCVAKFENGGYIEFSDFEGFHHCNRTWVDGSGYDRFCMNFFIKPVGLGTAVQVPIGILTTVNKNNYIVANFRITNTRVNG